MKKNILMILLALILALLPCTAFAENSQFAANIESITLMTGQFGDRVSVDIKFLGSEKTYADVESLTVTLLSETEALSTNSLNVSKMENAKLSFLTCPRIIE